MGHMRRREFIYILGGAAAWPVAASAQPSKHLRRISVLMAIADDDPEAQRRVAAFESGWPSLGWVKGDNLQIHYRWASGNLDNIRNILDDH